jgi:o-succinylbenzoate---CoA ligase
LSALLNDRVCGHATTQNDSFIPMKYPTTVLAETMPDLPAVIEGGRIVTHAELERQVVDAAGRLGASGVEIGDRVALLAPNSVEWIVIAHAVARLSAILTPISTRLAPAEILILLELYDPRVLLTDSRSEFTLSAGSPWSDKIIYLGEPSDNTRMWWRRISTRTPELTSDLDPQSISTIISTSGTTGRPKGVCLSPGNHLAAAEASNSNLASLSSDRWLINLPLFHIGGLAILYRAALSGMAMVVHERFDAQQTAEAIAQLGITHMSLVENMLRRLLDAWGEHSFPATLRGVLVGGGPVDVELLHRARSLGLPVMPTYGLTEAASQVATLSPESPVSRLGTVGRPLPTCELRIRGEDGRPVPAGSDGKIDIRGRMVTRGYWISPREMRPALSDGWLSTGDTGVLDADGFLTVHGRTDDMIVTGGENIFPAEIEACLTRISWIHRAAVLGMDDAQWGQVPVAFLEVQPGQSLNPANIADTLSKGMARYKVPKRFVVFEHLPVTAAGKIDRPRLIELYRAQAGRVYDVL